MDIFFPGGGRRHQHRRRSQHHDPERQHDHRDLAAPGFVFANRGRRERAGSNARLRNHQRQDEDVVRRKDTEHPNADPARGPPQEERFVIRKPL